MTVSTYRHLPRIWDHLQRLFAKFPKQLRWSSYSMGWKPFQQLHISCELSPQRGPSGLHTLVFSVLGTDIFYFLGLFNFGTFKFWALFFLPHLFWSFVTFWSISGLHSIYHILCFIHFCFWRTQWIFPVEWKKVKLCRKGSNLQTLAGYLLPFSCNVLWHSFSPHFLFNQAITFLNITKYWLQKYSGIQQPTVSICCETCGK